MYTFKSIPLNPEVNCCIPSVTGEKSLKEKQGPQVCLIFSEFLLSWSLPDRIFIYLSSYDSGFKIFVYTELFFSFIDFFIKCLHEPDTIQMPYLTYQHLQSIWIIITPLLI